MKSQIVLFPHRQKIIAPSTWKKKELADAHLDALLYCEFKCTYCSSNSGRHLKTLSHSIAEAVQEVTGRPFNPHDADDITIAYQGLVEAFETELTGKHKKPGAGKTLVYSQLTDGFSPVLLQTGTAERLLKLLMEKTAYRIRILTKNRIVGTPKWIKFFSSYPGRFVVGLSIGTLDNAFGQTVERLTSSPSSRVAALRALQDAGVPTFGMLCPVFPTVLENQELEELIQAIRPELCEHVWAEPYNNRQNWSYVRECFEPQSFMWNWMSQVYEERDQSLWSRYATGLYTRIRNTARRDGWIARMKYLLYEDQITSTDAEYFKGLEGVLLQSKADGQGVSRNPNFAQFQANLYAK
jgi:DNA repair photolyase